MKVRYKLMLPLVITVCVMVGFIGGGLLTKYIVALPDEPTSIPSIINYQGTLVSPSTGQPVPDGEYTFNLGIYEAEFGGSPLWQETQAVQVSGGIFNVLLGSVNPLTSAAFSSHPRYLGIAVGSDDEMIPRQVLASVPYAFQAENAQTVQGIPANMITKGYDPGKIAQFRWYEINLSGSNINIPCGAICFDGDFLWVGSMNTLDRIYKCTTSGEILDYYRVYPTKAICSDGFHIWYTNYPSTGAWKYRASDWGGSGGATVGTNPSAICFDGEYIWVTVESTNSVVKVKASDASKVGTYGVGSIPRGICYDGTNIWVSNSGDNNVMKINRADGSIQGTYNVGDTPTNMCFDGENIWVVNEGSDNVTKLKAADGSFLGNYAVGAAPYGICFDGESIWVTNFDSNDVTKLRASDGSLIGTFSGGFDEPSGICFDGVNIWVASSGNGKVFKL